MPLEQLARCVAGAIPTDPSSSALDRNEAHKQRRIAAGIVVNLVRGVHLQGPLALLPTDIRSHILEFSELFCDMRDVTLMRRASKEWCKLGNRQHMAGKGTPRARESSGGQRMAAASRAVREQALHIISDAQS